MSLEAIQHKMAYLKFQYTPDHLSELVDNTSLPESSIILPCHVTTSSDLKLISVESFTPSPSGEKIGFCTFTEISAGVTSISNTSDAVGLFPFLYFTV